MFFLNATLFHVRSHMELHFYKSEMKINNNKLILWGSLFTFNTVKIKILPSERWGGYVQTPTLTLSLERN